MRGRHANVTLTCPEDEWSTRQDTHGQPSFETGARLRQLPDPIRIVVRPAVAVILVRVAAPHGTQLIPRQLQLGAVCGDLLLRLALCGLGGTAVGQIGEADGDAGGRLQTWAADFSSAQWRNCCTALETGSGMTRRPTAGVQALKVPVIVRGRVKALGSPSSVSLSPVASQVASPLVGRPGQSHDQDRSCPIGQERS
ncbi:hypothetical protein AMK21_30285 [Streptomyces sp. CB00316]|nr:hypothetical protein AMK21_30285 [Streptomyces sp. CB00316]